MQIASNVPNVITFDEYTERVNAIKEKNGIPTNDPLTFLFERNRWGVGKNNKWVALSDDLNAEVHELENSLLARSIKSYILGRNCAFTLQEETERAHKKAIATLLPADFSPTDKDLLVLWGAKFDKNSLFHLLDSDVMRTIVSLQFPYFLFDFNIFMYVYKTDYKWKNIPKTDNDGDCVIS